MTAHKFLFRALAVPACCLLLTACASTSPEPEADTKPAPAAAAPVEPQPAPKADTKPTQGGVKVAPKASAGTKTAAPAKQASTKQSAGKAEPDEVVKQKLDDFAHRTIAEMNRHVMPSKQKMQVTQHPDGSYVCRYIEVDPASIRTSFKKPESSTAVTYIGYLTYDEGEYVCKAPTKEAAMAGPFLARQKTSMTELIKYMKNTWSY